MPVTHSARGSTKRHIALVTGLVIAAVSPPAGPAAASLVGRQPLTARTPTSSSASATTTAEAERRIADLLPRRIAADALLRGHVAGIVRDAATGRTVWSSGGSDSHLPASTTKIATAIAALSALGPDTTLKTSVHRGVSTTRIVLRAGGDPELTTWHLDQLASRTASVEHAEGRSAVSLRVDDALFRAPSLAPGWLPSYIPDEVTLIRGLKVDRHYVSDTSLHAATVFARLLARHDVRVTSVARERLADSRGEIAYVRGWTVRAIVQRMLNVSSNDAAEYLARLVSRAVGRGTDWASVRAGTRSALWRAGVPLDGFSAYDGSGVSRSNRISPLALTRFLRHVEVTPGLRAAFYADGALPRSGIDGTLGTRYRTFPTSCARGLVRAKTGTLTGAVTLAGRTTATDGRSKVFAVMAFDRAKEDDPATRNGVDKLATTVTGCW